MTGLEDMGFDPREKRETVKPLWYFEVESAHIKWKDDVEKEEQVDRSVGVHASLEVGNAHRQTSGIAGEEPRTVSKLEAELSQSRHRINEGCTRVMNYLGEMQQVLASQDRFRKGEGCEHVRRRYGNQHGRQLAGEWICRRPSLSFADSLSTSTSDKESTGNVRRRDRQTKNLFVNVEVGESDPLLSYSAFHTDMLRIQTGQRFFGSGIRESGSSKVPSMGKPYSIPTLEPLGASAIHGGKRKLKDAVGLVKTMAKLSGGRGVPGQTRPTQSTFLQQHPELTSSMGAVRAAQEAFDGGRGDRPGRARGRP